MNKDKMRSYLAGLITGMNFRMQTTDMLDKSTSEYQNAVDDLYKLFCEIIQYSKTIDGVKAHVAEIRYASRNCHYFTNYFEHLIRETIELSDRG